MFTHSRPGQVQITGDLTDTLLADETTAPDLGNQIHEQQPQLLQRKRRMIARPGWKLLDAVYPRNLESFARCFTDGFVAAIEPCGAILAEHFPPGTLKRDELPDKLLEI